MLSLADVSVQYGGIAALHRVSLEVAPGEILAILGANGAGKSTLLKAIMGLVPLSGGRIQFLEQDISGLPTEQIVTRGLSLVPEPREIFPNMTCRDNLRLGLFSRSDLAAFESRVETVHALFPRLLERNRQLAGTLSGGEQQMLAIGRALMQHPELLLLDEPSFGLAPALTQDLFQKIVQISSGGKTIVLVEQRARLALEIAQRAYVISVGKVVREGLAAELRADQEIQRLYLGG